MNPAPATRAVQARARQGDTTRRPREATAPPLHRGSMTPRSWTGFWRGLGLGLAALWQRRPRPDTAPLQAWQRAAQRRRRVFLLLIAACTAGATALYAQVLPEGGATWLRGAQIALYALLSGWVTSGFVTALMGAWVALRGDVHALSAHTVRHQPLDPAARTAIVMPICHEDVATVFTGLRASCESLAAAARAGQFDVAQFDVFVLSDSSDPATLAAERAAWAELHAALAAAPQAQVAVHYRARRRRTRRKAGNVADFCRRWGRDYRYMIVLDADSVMSGDCLATLVKLMEAHPRAGILQTAPQAVGHLTLHARAQQFASRVTGRLFTLGMQYWQLGESHYWGHNAIIRMAPFMQHCALASLPGRGALSGPVLSHDFVEAALMRRAGYHVWLVGELAGSFEQQPPDLLAELQRDRRWCHGNLQNARLLAEPGLHPAHRAMLAVGALSYLCAPLWLAFLALGTVGATLFAETRAAAPLWILWAWTLTLLFLPRVLGLGTVLLQGHARRYGGAFGLLRSALTEAGLALLQAPIRMAAHTLFVAAALTGWKLEWKSPPRAATTLRWRDAAARLAPLTLAAATLTLGLLTGNTHALLWLSPVALPLLLAVPLTVWSSCGELGARLRARGLLLIPEELWSPTVLRRAWRHVRV